MSTFGERLRRSIETTGMNIMQACDKAQIPYRSMQNYLRGEREPKAEALSQMCASLGISANWLLLEVGEIRLGQAAAMSQQAGSLRQEQGVWADLGISDKAGEGQGEGARPGFPIHDPEFKRLADFQRWQVQWWAGASEDERIWMDITLRRTFPEYAQALETSGRRAEGAKEG